MVDWLAIAGACLAAAVIGLGFVLWEHFEQGRQSRAQTRRRLVEPALARVPARHRLDVRSGRRAA